MMRNSSKREMPSWWPEGEPWPSHGHPTVTIRRRRTWFFRRVAFGLFALALIMILSLLAFVWLLAPRTGPGDGAAALGALVLLFMAVAVVLLVFRSMQRIGSPLHAVMDAADRVADGDYGVRVREYGPPPMRALAHSFNTMTERLQNADRLRRNIMADVAHELRTPLSVLQGRLEGLIDGVYPRDDRQLGELLEETRVLSRLIEDLRTLALSDAGALPLQKEATDLVDLVRDVVRSMTPEADKKSVSLSAGPSVAMAVTDVDPVRMREVLTNIVSNSLRHSASGSSVTVAVDQTQEKTAIVVRDAGEGMPPEEVARIFDRFYKGSVSRGSGLGLAIAKSIVTAHGGEIQASSELGRGTTVELSLPKSHPASG
jgi:two-component system OmpR family sensor kinase/two-component system sensor histidine kinase BaeS